MALIKTSKGTFPDYVVRNRLRDSIGAGPTRAQVYLEEMVKEHERRGWSPFDNSYVARYYEDSPYSRLDVNARRFNTDALDPLLDDDYYSEQSTP